MASAARERDDVIHMDGLGLATAVCAASAVAENETLPVAKRYADTARVATLERSTRASPRLHLLGVSNSPPDGIGDQSLPVRRVVGALPAPARAVQGV